MILLNGDGSLMVYDDGSSKAGMLCLSKSGNAERFGDNLVGPSLDHDRLDENFMAIASVF
ncbi:hypothetical protein BDB00DRAFT_872340 [Zychaea mexicana]|uniref:uncharacterized protein n=1 Tax=Zychaea mexicana TaxID=64656 RepID=UPI0022FEB6C6|nr:uncharacterized protein BDB00DRAFT_872340 [Zychaea mexicana]KAI9493453.1 hypothetical protein BDB00DRAFT_872340 [Zychaea mexicana]